MKTQIKLNKGKQGEDFTNMYIVDAIIIMKKKSQTTKITGQCKKIWLIDSKIYPQKTQLIESIHHFLAKFDLERIMSWVARLKVISNKS